MAMYSGLQATAQSRRHFEGVRCQALTLLLGVFFLISGCSNQPKQVLVDLDWQQHSKQVLALSRWRAQGKLALRNLEHAESAEMDWRQQDDITQLHLQGPLGIGATKIYADASMLEITRDGESRRYDVSSPVALATQIGWDLPVSALHHWLKGVPAPDLEIQEQQIDQGQLRQLKQSDWHVRYDSYDQFGQYRLPTRINIERGDTRAKLIIRQWTIGGS